MACQKDMLVPFQLTIRMAGQNDKFVPFQVPDCPLDLHSRTMGILSSWLRPFAGTCEISHYDNMRVNFHDEKGWMIGSCNCISCASVKFQGLVALSGLITKIF